MDYVYYDDDDDDEYEEGLQQYEPVAGHSSNGPNGPNGRDNDVEDYFSDQLPNIAQTVASELADIFEVCIAPSVLQISGYMASLLISCLAYRLLCRLLLRRRIVATTGGAPMHLVAIVCGLFALYMSLGRLTVIVFVISTVSYALLYFIRQSGLRNIGCLVAVITISSQILYELYLRKPEAWHRVRGVQMVANMKIISIAFDLEERRDSKSKTAQLPKLLAYLGYIFCPGTCALGPWISFQTYMQSLRASYSDTNSRLWPLHVLLNILMALVYLTVSNCLAPVVIGGAIMETGWLRNYIDALGVRTSHYFISFLTQAGLAAAGISLSQERTNPPHMLLGSLITEPWSVELPRSLSSLVRCWNIPMHDWLKKYIYRASLQRLDARFASLAVLWTYVVSSLLHGVHLRIYLVLLSLGIFAYVEALLRRRLADIFDACIGANSCGKHCKRRYCSARHREHWRCWRLWLIWLTNIFFSAVTIFNLAYLGVALADNNDSNDGDDTGSDAFSILSRWQLLDYLNHYIVLGAFIFYLFIS